MKYVGLPMAMWVVFHKFFQRNLTEILKYDEQESRKISVAAKKKYKELIEKLPADRIAIAGIRKKDKKILALKRTPFYEYKIEWGSIVVIFFLSLLLLLFSLS